MTFNVMTIFPEMIDYYCSQSILGRARKSDIIKVNSFNIRDFSKDKHRKVDDTPYGGGMGMLMSVQPIFDCYNSFKDTLKGSSVNIYMSPKGKKFDHNKAVDLAKYENINILCGHYEGVDQRVIDSIIDEEISIGDFVLTGGEIAACVIIDSVSRLIPGVLSDDICFQDESIASGLLEYPQYTKPSEYNGMCVPKVLLDGNHKDIIQWRRKKALEETLLKRPELLNNEILTKEDILYLETLNNKD